MYLYVVVFVCGGCSFSASSMSSGTNGSTLGVRDARNLMTSNTCVCVFVCVCVWCVCVFVCVCLCVCVLAVNSQVRGGQGTHWYL